MANTDKATGFVYDFRLSDEHPPMLEIEMASNTTLSDGDPVTIDAGYARLAATGESVFGVVVGSDNPRWDGGLTTGSGDNPSLNVCVALEDVVFRVHDANASPTIATRGTNVDMVGASGAVGIDSSVATNGDFYLLDRAWADAISGNEWGPDMQWVGIFAKRMV